MAICFLGLLVTVAAACSGTAPTPSPILAQPATSTSVPTAIVSPTPTPTPSPTASPLPTSGLPPSSRTALTDTAFGFLTHLVEELGPRESATQQELDAAEYLADQLESFGYSVELQPFCMELVSEEQSGLVLEGPDPQGVEGIPLLQSGIGQVSAELVSVGLAREGDVPEGGLEGKIALAERGQIRFEEKVNRLVEAGAAAAVIYNNRPGTFRGGLLSQRTIPVLGISQEDGLRIEELLSDGTVEATVTLKTEERASRNVVAEKQGRGEDVVVLGAHFDTVPNISGANDNASGTAVLLTVAGELSRETLPFTLRFIAFGSEELGLEGSLHYVASLNDAQRERIKAMFNFDAVGSGEHLGILGSRELTNLASEQGDDQGIEVRVSPGLPGGGSDHFSFSNAGIPVIMFFSEDFSRIHTPADTLSFVTPSHLGDAAGLALALLRSEEFLAVLK